MLTFLARVEQAAPDGHAVTFPELIRALASYGHDDPGKDEHWQFRRIVVGERLDRLAMRAPERPPVQPLLDALDDDGDRAALNGVLDDTASVLRTWQEKKIFVYKDDVGIEILLGPGSSPAIAAAAQRYEATAGRPFPPLLRAFLAINDGMHVQGIPTANVVLAEMPHPDVTNGILPAHFVTRGESANDAYLGLVIGRVYGQYPLLLVDGGKHAGKVVFDDFENPEIIASSLADFLSALAAHGLSAPVVIRART